MQYGIEPEFGDMTDVQFSTRNERKTFAKNKNANGVFVIELLIDLANPNSEWFTGGHIYDILSINAEDDTQFRNFYHELYERNKNMDDYESYEGDPVEDSFIVRDGNGKSFLYTVLLDGYLHGVILEKSDVNALRSVLLKGALATKNGKSSAYIKGRISNARTNNRRNASADVGTYSANGDVGYGRVGGRTPESVTEGNNSRKDSFNQTVRTVNNRLSLEHGKKDVEVSSTDEQQVRRGIISSEQASADRGSGSSRRRRNGPSVKTQIKQLRSEIRELEDRRDFAYDKIEKRSIQEKIDEIEYRIRQMKAEIENQPQTSDRIEEESSVPADITEEMRQHGEKVIETATAQREAKVAAEQETHRAIRAALTNRDLIAQNKGKGGGFTDKNAHIQQRKAEEETAYIAESCFGKMLSRHLQEDMF